MNRLLTLLLFGVGMAMHAQNSVDVLMDSLNMARTPEAKLALSQRIATQLQDMDWERALTYLELAEREAQKTKTPNTYLADIYVTTARMYNTKDVLDVTVEYYQKAHDIYEDLQNTSELAKVENNLAIAYAQTQNKEKALKYFKRVYAYQASQKDSLRLAQILNNMGTLYLDKDPDSSQAYYERSLRIVERIKDSVLFAYLYTNLARLHHQQDEEASAKRYFAKAIACTKGEMQPPIKAFIYQSLSEYHLEKNQDSAVFYSRKALELQKEHPYTFTYLDGVKTLYEAYIKQGEFEQAAQYFEQYNGIRDSLNVEEKAVNVERLKLQEEYKTRNEIRELQEEKQRNQYLLIGLSLVVGILALLMLLVHYRNRVVKNKLERELLKTKQQELKQTLDAKNKVLVGKAMNEMHRTDVINGILKDLKQIKLKAIKKETQEAIDFIVTRLGRDLNTDIWQEFEVSFEQVHKSFYKNLTKNHPDLSPKDRRLCALLFLDMTSKEISQITGQSFKSVENARTRLRKKLELTNEKVNLSTYLNSLSVE